MPRIPRADPQVSTQIANMPQLAGEGWTAPGRATQQLGQGIQKLGTAFDAIAAQQDDEQLHEARLKALNLKNAWDLDEINTQSTYTGDGKSYQADRSTAWAARVQPFVDQYSNAGPKVRRFVQTFAATATGQVVEGAARFGRSRWLDHLYSESDAAVTGVLSQMATPEAAERYKTDPAQFEADLRLKIQEANGIIDALPLRDGRQDALRKKAAAEIERIIASYPPSYSINAIRSKIEEFQKGPAAAPGPQSALPSGPVRFMDPPLERTSGRPREAPIKGIVLHQTWGSDTMEGNGSWSNQRNTGANYYIDKSGAVYRWAPDDVAMNHVGAGRDHPNNRRPDLGNDNTIGIEIMTRPNERPNEKQIAAARALSLELAKTYKLDPQKDVFGHGELTNPNHRRSDEAIEAVDAIRGANRIAQVPRETSSGVSPEGLAFIKGVEGERLTAYRDGRQYSIGYGSRAKSRNETITVEEAGARLDAELKQANAAVDKAVTVPLNRNQRDALVSYVYNAGPNGAARQVFEAVNAGDTAKAAQIMLADDKGGQVAGRRQKEVDLLNKPDVSGRAFTAQGGRGGAREANHIPAADTGGTVNAQPSVLRPSVEHSLVEVLQKQLPALQRAYRAQVMDTVKAVEEAAAKGTLPTEAEQGRIGKMVGDLGDKDVAAAYQNALVTAAVNAEYKSLPPDVIANQVTRLKLQLARDGAQIVPKRGGAAGAEGGVAEGLDPVTATTRRKVDALEALHKRMVEELKKNPRAWAAEAGVILQTPEITKDNFGPALLAKRAEETDAIAGHYGEEFRQYFSPEERDRLKDMFKVGGQPMVAMAGMMVEGFGPKAISAFKEIADDAPEAATLGWMVVNKAENQTTRDLADAVALKHAEGGKFHSIAPKADDARNRALSLVGQGLGATPQAEQRAIQVANAIYEIRARRAGVDPKAGPSWDIWEKAYREALGENTDKGTGTVYGGPASRGGFLSFGRSAGTVIVPPNVKQSGLSDLVAAVTLADIAPGGIPQAATRLPTDTEKAAAARGRQTETPETASAPGSEARIADTNRMLGYGNQTALDAIATQGAPMDERGRPVKLSTLQRATLVNTGREDGQYWLALGDPYGDNPSWVRSTSSQDGRFVLDLKALEPVLRQRRPDLYRPY